MYLNVLLYYLDQILYIKCFIYIFYIYIYIYIYIYYIYIYMGYFPLIKAV